MEPIPEESEVESSHGTDVGWSLSSETLYSAEFELEDDDIKPDFDTWNDRTYRIPAGVDTNAEIFHTNAQTSNCDEKGSTYNINMKDDFENTNKKYFPVRILPEPGDNEHADKWLLELLKCQRNRTLDFKMACRKKVEEEREIVLDSCSHIEELVHDDPELSEQEMKAASLVPLQFTQVKTMKREYKSLMNWHNETLEKNGQLIELTSDQAIQAIQQTSDKDLEPTSLKADKIVEPFEQISVEDAMPIEKNVEQSLHESPESKQVDLEEKSSTNIVKMEENTASSIDKELEIQNEGNTQNQSEFVLNSTKGKDFELQLGYDLQNALKFETDKLKLHTFKKNGTVTINLFPPPMENVYCCTNIVHDVCSEKDQVEWESNMTVEDESSISLRSSAMEMSTVEDESSRSLRSSAMEMSICDTDSKSDIYDQRAFEELQTNHTDVTPLDLDFILHKNDDNMNKLFDDMDSSSRTISGLIGDPMIGDEDKSKKQNLPEYWLTKTISKEIKLSLKNSSRSKSSVDELEMCQSRCKFTESDFISLQQQVTKLQHELEAKNLFIKQWHYKITKLNDTINHHDQMCKKIGMKNQIIYDLEHENDQLKRILEENEIIIKNKDKEIEMLQTTIDDRNSTILTLKKAEVENETMTGYLQTMQTNLREEIRVKDEKLKKSHLALQMKQVECEDVSTSKCSLVVEVKKLRSNCDALSKEKNRLMQQKQKLQNEVQQLMDKRSKDKISSNSELVSPVEDLETKALQVDLYNKNMQILQSHQRIKALTDENEEKTRKILLLSEKLESVNLMAKGDTGFFTLQSKTSRCDLLKMKAMVTEIRALNVQLSNKQTFIENIKIQLESRDGRIQYYHTMMIVYQNEFAKIEERMRKLQTRLKTKLKAVDAVENFKMKMTYDLERAKDEVKEKIQLNASLKNEVDFMKEEIANVNEVIKNYRSQIISYQKKLYDMTQQKDKKDQEMEFLQTQNTTLQNKLDKLCTQIESKKLDLQTILSQFDLCQEENMSLQKVIDDRNYELEQLTHLLHTTKIELDDKEMVISHMQSIICRLQHNEKSKSSVIEKLNERFDCHTQGIQKFSFILINLQAEINSLKSQFKGIDADSAIVKSFKRSLFKTELSAWYCQQELAESEQERNERFHIVLTNESHALKSKYNETSQLRDCLANCNSNNEVVMKSKILCVDLEVQLLQQQLSSNELLQETVAENFERAKEEKESVSQQIELLRKEQYEN